MSALCCRSGDSPLVAASRVTLSVQLYAELGALGLVSTMIAIARPHPDERNGLAVAALWLAVSTGCVALGSCMVSLRGLRHGNAAPRFVAAALGAGMALATVSVVIAALQNKRGHEHTSGDDRKRTRTVLAVTLLMEMSLALLRGVAADVIRKIVGDQFRTRGDEFDEVTGPRLSETSRVRPVRNQKRDPGVFTRAPPKPHRAPTKPSRQETCVICQENIWSGQQRLPCAHVFHQACLEKWLPEHRSCPVCRTHV